jgi:ribonuclease III
VDLEQFQNVIGIRFNQPELLAQALTHRSYVNEQIEQDLDDNERLEFLGDAILDFLTADMLYSRFPDMDEGEMTRLRAALVRTEALAQLAMDCQLGEALLMGKGEANSGGRMRNNNLCSGFEAVVGAIYLDQGLEVVKQFVIPRLTELQKDVMEEAIRKDPRSQFQEWAQARYSITPDYRLSSATGPDHDKDFAVEVFIGDKNIALGYGKSKRSAAQSAAQAALDMLAAGSLELEL